MESKGLLFATEVKINSLISIVVPSVGDVLDTENEYYSNLSLITATPYNAMVQLDDIGIDFSKITEFDLFLMLFRELQQKDVSLIFKDIRLKDFELAVNPQNNLVVLANPATGAVIDSAIHDKICTVLRKINNLEKTNLKPGNEAARQYMIERARIKQARALRKAQNVVADDSRLEELIVALVNTEQFPYNFQTVRDISIYQLNASERQILRKINYDNIMRGFYSGSISSENINKNDLNWIYSTK